jgi:hypothetical protein
VDYQQQVFIILFERIEGNIDLASLDNSTTCVVFLSYISNIIVHLRGCEAERTIVEGSESHALPIICMYGFMMEIRM